MEFIFELFAEILGRAEDSSHILSETEAAQNAHAELGAEAQPETESQSVNIFNVVNFH